MSISNLKSRRHLNHRFFALYGFVSVAGVATLVFPILQYLVFLSLFALLVLVLRDRKYCLQPKHLELELTKTPATVLDQSAVLSMTLIIHEVLIYETKIRIYSPISNLLEFRKAFYEFDLSVAKTQEIKIDLPYTVRHVGFESWESLRIETFSPFKLWITVGQINIGSFELRTYPQKNQTPDRRFLQFLKSHQRFFSGSKLQISNQSPDQIHTIRKYQYPDPIRFIDPKKTAKLQIPMTKTFETYHQMHFVRVLDVGRNMLGSIQNSTSQKIDYYISALISFIELARQNHDQVTLVSFADEIKSVVSSKLGFASFNSLYRGERAYQPFSEESNYELIPDCIQRATGQRAIVVLFSDCTKVTSADGVLALATMIGTKHKLLIMTLVESIADTDQMILDWKVTSPKTKSFNHRYAELLNSYWTSQNESLLDYKLTSKNVALASVSLKYWMSAQTKLYALLRSSLST